MRASWGTLLGFGLGLASAADPKKILVIQEFDALGYENGFVRADTTRYTVTAITKQIFSSYTSPQYAAFDAIVIGDDGTGCPNAGSATTLDDFIDSYVSSKLSSAVTGNVYVSGTSLTYNHVAATDSTVAASVDSVFQGAMDYVTSGPTTGLYISLSCYYKQSSVPTGISALDGFRNGGTSFQLIGNNDCSKDVLITQGSVFNGVQGTDINRWNCPIMDYFVNYPSIFTPAAVGDNSGAQGTPYIFIRNSVSDCGNSIVTGKETCDGGSNCLPDCTCPAGYESDGQISCRKICGNGELNDNEECEPEGPKKRGLAGLSVSGLFGRGSATDPLCLEDCTCPFGPGEQRGTCAPEKTCGNNVLDSGEECEYRKLGRRDPATDISDPYCGSNCKCTTAPGTTPGTCLPPKKCGNGQLDDGEQCEPRQLTKRMPLFGRSGLFARTPDISDPLCTSDCVCPFGVGSTAGTCAPKQTCGDGDITGTEECDDAGVSATCTKLCTCVNGYDKVAMKCLDPVIPPKCGDSTVDAQDDEECEISISGAELCSTACKCIWGVDATTKACLPVPICGNSEIEKGEDCDDQSDPLCDECKCLLGLGDDGKCKPKPEVPTSTVPTSTQPTQSSSQPPASTTTPSSVPTTSPTSSAAPTSTNEPIPPQLGIFSRIGCTGSVQSYPSFSLMTSSDSMTLEMCTEACSEHLYAGVHVRDCYCSDFFDDVVTVAKDECSVPCPGNPLENCGGYRQVTKERRQVGARVPSNALLVVFLNDQIAATATVPLPPVSTQPPTSGAAAPATTTQTTATATAVVTASATETVTPCVNGWCHVGGYAFQLCQGLPNAGEVVFVMQACSCYGGWQYVQASCDGASCAGLAVYRAVPVSGGGNSGGSGGDVVVYNPQPCDTCAGGVTFVQPTPPPAAGGNSTVVVPGSPSVVVVAGASKLTAFFSSLSIFVGAFALLI